MMKRGIGLGIALTLCVTQAKAQTELTKDDSTGRVHYGLSAAAVATANGVVPFWMRSNRYGDVPLSGLSAGFSAYAVREYKHDDEERLTDWGAGVNGRLNLGREGQFLLTDAYVKARLSIFQVRAGRYRSQMGIADRDLSSGNFAVSGNALGIPNVDISIPQYWDLPLTRGYVAVKGNFLVGDVGKLKTEENAYMPGVKAQTWYHQKSLYGRIGKETSLIQLYGGFNHQVFWGDENRYFEDWGLSPLKTAIKAFTGGVYKGSKIGNHLGSIDQAIALQLPKTTITAYHEFFYDVGGLYHLNNIKDGLWGLSLQNTTDEPNANIGWTKVLVEFMNSKSQGGEPTAKITPSGDENYYNGMYVEGWTYQGMNIGMPLLTNRNDMRENLPTGSYRDFIVNNRVTALHLGVMGNVKDWAVMVKGTYSMNYGTWGSHPWGHSNLTLRNPLPGPYFGKVTQLSGYLEASRKLNNGFSIGFAVAGDYGKLLHNSVGGMVKLSKAW